MERHDRRSGPREPLYQRHLLCWSTPAIFLITSRPAAQTLSSSSFSAVYVQGRPLRAGQGEKLEMPGMREECDLAGTIVGVVDRQRCSMVHWSGPATFSSASFGQFAYQRLFLRKCIRGLAKTSSAAGTSPDLGEGCFAC
jgi:hypothetical protein